MHNQQFDPSISLQKTDATIINYITQVIKPMVTTDSGDVVVVPVLYNGAERWVQTRKRKYIVDQYGNVKYPVISFSRISVSYHDPKILNRIWTNGTRNFITIQNRYSKQRPFSRVDLQSGNIRPKPAVINLMIPIDITCRYEFQFYTDSWQDTNDLIQVFMIYGDRWWVIDNHRIKVKIQQYSNTVQMMQSQQRIIKTSFSMQVLSTLLPKSYQPLSIIDENTIIKFKVGEFVQ